MTQYPSDVQTALLQRITAALQSGGSLSEATLNYIDASLFHPDPERLTAFLLDDADSERDTLLDLIFYPDQPLQIDLEPLLEQARLRADQARELGAALAEQSVQAPIRMPGGRRLVQILVPDFVKSRYLDRLNLTWQLDPQVAAAIDRHVAPARQTLIKVRLRNTGRRFNNGQAGFLARFLARMPDDATDFIDCLNLVLSILPASTVRVDAWDVLVEHKRACFRSLQQIRRFDALRQRANMETLMLQGVRAPHASADELMRRMRLIDRVCMQVFGRTEAIEPPTETPLRRIDDPDDPEALFRSLLP